MRKITIAAIGAGLGLTLLAGSGASVAQPKTVAGAACGATSQTAVPDNATEPKSGRKFILQYPCDLKPNEKITLILNIHGAGSSSSYQHRYFPAGDYAQKYRLVVATPTAAAPQGNGSTRTWQAAADDQYLRDLSDLLITSFGKQNIKSFWLSGHSQGGATSARIVCSDYFKARVDGFFSLSGGRQGGTTGRNANYNAPAPGAPVPAAVPNQGPGPARGAAPGGAPGAAPGAPPAAGRGPLTPAADGPTTCDYSHIYDSGEWEIDAMPEASTIATKFGCTRRTPKPDIVDAQPGYVWDPSRQNPTRIGWGRQMRPGTAKEWVWDGCKGGRVVADFLRIDKGHTEGLEPKVTEEIVRLITSASGGKVQKL